jgi:acyl-coenzyme A thioesterase PaaI-like protein
MTSVTESRGPSLIADLGLDVRLVGDELHGEGEVVPAMWVPGTPCLRASVLAAWADTVLGFLAIDVVAPRVPVTVELDVHLFHEIREVGVVHYVGRPVKVGRTMQVSRIDFFTPDGEALGFGHSLFTAGPDPGVSIPTMGWAIERFHSHRSILTEPFAVAADCTRERDGRATLPRADHLINGSNTINGGLLALVVEEAALSAGPVGRTLTSLQLRYLRPVRGGPAVAHAEVVHELGTVEVRDASTGNLAVLATTRHFEA